MENQNYIGLQIRIHRRAKGLTQDELSRQSGIHYNTIVQLENLTKPANPTIMTLRKLAGVLGVGITTLICNS